MKWRGRRKVGEREEKEAIEEGYLNRALDVRIDTVLERRNRRNRMRVSRTSLLVGLLAAQLLAGPIVGTLGAAVKSDQQEVCHRLGTQRCSFGVLADCLCVADNRPLHPSVLRASFCYLPVHRKDSCLAMAPMCIVDVMDGNGSHCVLGSTRMPTGGPESGYSQQVELSALQEPGMYQKVKDTVNTVLHGESAEQAKQYAASK